MARTIFGVAYSKTCTDMSFLFKWAEMSCDFLYNQPPPCPPTRGSLCPALWSAGELKENNLTALAAGIF